MKSESGSFSHFSPSPPPRRRSRGGDPVLSAWLSPSMPGWGVSARAPEERLRTAAPPLARWLALPPLRRHRDSAKLSERAPAAQRVPGWEREQQPRAGGEGRAAGGQEAAARESSGEWRQPGPGGRGGGCGRRRVCTRGGLLPLL